MSRTINNEKMTHLDQIRNMTDDELVDLLFNPEGFFSCEDCYVEQHKMWIERKNCRDWIKEWGLRYVE